MDIVEIKVKIFDRLASAYPEKTIDEIIEACKKVYDFVYKNS